VCLLGGLRGWRRLGMVESDLAAGIVLTFLFYFFFRTNQGHGWGYRFFFPILGNIAIVASSAAGQLVTAWSRRTVLQCMVASLALSVLVQWPLRGQQIEAFVRPFSQGIDLIQATSSGVVIVDGRDLWYGDDLIRNDPFLKPPVVLRAEDLTPVLRTQLESRWPSGVKTIGKEELMRVGWPSLSRE
jgi:hypothetical protein